jgi:hypothetical protein
MGAGPPIELSDMPCGVVLLYRRPDGRLVASRKPCDTKGCPGCGPRLRRQWTEQWAHAMGGERVHRLVVGDVELAKLRRRKVMDGQQVGVIPGPDGQRVVYTTAPVGSVCEDVPLALTRDFTAMPSDTRRRSLSAGWAQVIADLQVEDAATREAWECLGRIARSIEHVALVATELGLLVGRGADVVIVAEPPDPATWGRFAGLIRLQRGRHRRQVAA